MIIDEDSIKKHKELSHTNVVVEAELEEGEKKDKESEVGVRENEEYDVMVKKCQQEDMKEEVKTQFQQEISFSSEENTRINHQEEGIKQHDRIDTSLLISSDEINKIMSCTGS